MVKYGDLISKFRQWYSQFYVEHSETFKEAMEYEKNTVSLEGW